MSEWREEHNQHRVVRTTAWVEAQERQHSTKEDRLQKSSNLMANWPKASDG